MITLDKVQNIELDQDQPIVDAIVAKSTNIPTKDAMYGIWLDALGVKIEKGLPWDDLNKEQQQALNILGKACKKMGL